MLGYDFSMLPRGLTRFWPSHRVRLLSAAKERGRGIAAAGAAARTAREQEESLSEGRANERTHCCRTRAAMAKRSDC